MTSALLVGLSGGTKWRVSNVLEAISGVLASSKFCKGTGEGDYFYMLAVGMLARHYVISKEEKSESYARRLSRGLATDAVKDIMLVADLLSKPHEDSSLKWQDVVKVVQTTCI
eukprot:CAMPEP_0118723762 /NCGR_PEP_ID=MMETSP0800-20121206/32182_1 /TAXON_ID=210618 ORGANISM="Striatella unipunctata, Strain CCMP2910" /NCGR_SAMPLE_ID=MMETSP0800 /ASSEMBLY_ACC=CAM_ASM_000638 /LENGTH=112 /DNA_ID=CAMNT_0006632221 /DNA_START=33 /DNA_END=371 /DNA_ORIENTATION=+